MRKLLAGVFAGGALMAAMPASAAVVSLNFEGINAQYPSGFANILDFYNGGVSSDGTSGTNYGVSFGSNALAICLNTPGVSCSNTSRGGFGDPSSQRGGLFFLDGDQTYLNYAAGFTSGFSFVYDSASYSGAVNVYDGLNGVGNILATLNLSPNANSSSCPPGSGDFCPFSAAGVNFSGIARSIGFGGVANQIVFDDVTFGSSIPGPVSTVPEMATWGMVILGFGFVGGALRRRSNVLRVAYG